LPEGVRVWWMKLGKKKTVPQNTRWGREGYFKNHPGCQEKKIDEA